MITGISGHQDLSSYDLNWIKEQLQKVLSSLPITIGISSLAAGSDQLFASVLIKQEIPFKVIIPCMRYEETFTATRDLENYKLLLSGASQSSILDFSEPSEMAFFAAGKAVVESSNLLIAIWDGRKAKGLGGTGKRRSHRTGSRVLPGTWN